MRRLRARSVKNAAKVDELVQYGDVGKGGKRRRDSRAMCDGVAAPPMFKRKNPNIKLFRLSSGTNVKF